MNIHIKTILRTDFTKKDGTQSICLRLTINRQTKRIPLGIHVTEINWNETKARIKRADSFHYQNNLLLEMYETKARKIIFDFKIKDIPITFNNFKEKLFNSSYGNNSFFEFADAELSRSKNKLSKAAYTGYKSNFKMLREFKQDLNFNEIDISFIRSFENHLISKGNKESTINKLLTSLKTYINKAIAQGINNKENPFNNYKLKRVAGERAYLTLHEVEKLEKLLKNEDLPKNKERVLIYFLFACYTGLRYKDMINLSFENIHNTTYKDKTIKMISIVQHKTKRVVRIPIIPQAEKLLPECKFKEQKVFKVMTSQPTNRYLKEIAKAANIDKHLSFHVSRHTLATNSVELGMPIEILSQILGHTDLKTTQLYVKVGDGVKINQMLDKWK